MNKLRIHALKIALTIMVLFTASAGTAFAATTGQLLLQGTVPGILEITITPAADSGDLDLSIDAADVKVATVVERSNKKSGYTVTVESANAVTQSADNGVFINQDGTISETLNYSISYAGNPVTLSSGAALISDVSGKTTGTGESKDVAISYNGSSDFPYEGTYSDTLTFTIAAK